MTFLLVTGRDNILALSWQAVQCMDEHGFDADRPPFPDV